MNKVASMWVRYGTARNMKVVYILLSLVALAVASGAPIGGSGAGSGGGLESYFPGL